MINSISSFFRPMPIITIAYRPYRSAAPAPIETKASMPGARDLMPFQPLMKNARLIQQTGSVSASCTNANTMAPLPWPSINEGSGRPIICPIETYISGTKKHRLAIRRFFSFGVSVSSSSAFSLSAVARLAP